MRQVFRSSGVYVPIQIAHYGVDAHLFSPEGPRERLGLPDEIFVFLSVFGWSERKGPDVLVKAFLEEFSADDPVALVIKTHRLEMDDFPREWYHSLANQVSKPNPPQVHLLVQDLYPDQLASLYRGADCFVLPTRGEGVGLPFLESLASGRPVIATGWGAHLDFVKPNCGYLLPYTLVPARPTWFTDLYQPNQLWAEPNQGTLRSLLRRAFLMQDEVHRKGTEGRAAAVQWNWDRTTKEYVQAIEQVTGRRLT